MHLTLVFVVVAFLLGSFINQVSSAPSPVSGISLDARRIDRELAKFRPMVEKYLPKEPHDLPPYGDRFLLRFLSAWDFNREDAKNALKQYFEWREEENIDPILDANCTDMEERYPYTIGEFDFPYIDDSFSMASHSKALILKLENFDQTKLDPTPEDERRRLVRHVSIKMMEDINYHTLLMDRWSEKNPREPSQFPIVINLKGYGENFHGCPEFNQLQLEIIDTLLTRWREAIGRIYLMNAPNLPECVYEWIQIFKQRFGIDVQVRSGEVLEQKYHDEGSITCIHICGDSPLTIETLIPQTKDDIPDGMDFVVSKFGADCPGGCEKFLSRTEKYSYSCNSGKLATPDVHFMYRSGRYMAIDKFRPGTQPRSKMWV